MNGRERCPPHCRADKEGGSRVSVHRAVPHCTPKNLSRCLLREFLRAIHEFPLAESDMAAHHSRKLAKYLQQVELGAEDSTHSETTAVSLYVFLHSSSLTPGSTMGPPDFEDFAVHKLWPNESCECMIAPADLGLVKLLRRCVHIANGIAALPSTASMPDQ